MLIEGVNSIPSADPAPCHLGHGTALPALLPRALAGCPGTLSVDALSAVAVAVAVAAVGGVGRPASSKSSTGVRVTRNGLWPINTVEGFHGPRAERASPRPVGSAGGWRAGWVGRSGGGAISRLGGSERHGSTLGQPSPVQVMRPWMAGSRTVPGTAVRAVPSMASATTRSRGSRVVTLTERSG